MKNTNYNDTGRSGLAEEKKMKIYDISQEIFGCRVYPGDPAPEKKLLCSTEKGDGRKNGA